jgi:putative transposase
LQQELKNLDTAFNYFFKDWARFSKFHSKKWDKQSFRVPQFVTVEDNRIKFLKFRERIKVRLHHKIEDEIKYATVSCNRAGQYFVCICMKRVIKKLKKIKKEVSIDFDVKNLTTYSDRQVFENIKPYRSLERRLKYFHLNASRKPPTFIKK